MKYIWLLWLMVVPGMLAADKQPAAAPVKVALELVDGSRNIGTLSIASVPIKTPFAKMDVPLDRVQRIRFDKEQKSAVVELRNGDKVTGTTDLTAFKLTALFGPVSIAIEHVTHLSVIADKPAKPAHGAMTEKDRQIEEKMKKIILPEVDFQETAIAEVVEFLSEGSRESEDNEGSEEPEGVNFVLNLRSGADKRKDVTADPDGGDSTTRAESYPVITFKARRISLFEALKIVTQVAGLDYTIQNGVVMIHPKESE